MGTTSRHSELIESGREKMVRVESGARRCREGQGREGTERDPHASKDRATSESREKLTGRSLFIRNEHEKNLEQPPPW